MLPFIEKFRSMKEAVSKFGRILSARTSFNAAENRAILISAR